MLDFNLVDETEKGGAKIVLRMIEKAPNDGVNRRYRSGALKGVWKSKRLVVAVRTRGSVRVERLVRRLGAMIHCGYGH